MFPMRVPELGCESNLLKNQVHHGIRNSLCNHKSHQKSDVQAFLSQGIISLQVGGTLEGAEWLSGQRLSFLKVANRLPLACQLGFFAVIFFEKIICIIPLLFKRIACRLARAAKRINICPIKILPGAYAQVMECL